MVNLYQNILLHRYANHTYTAVISPPDGNDNVLVMSLAAAAGLVKLAVICLRSVLYSKAILAMSALVV